MSRDICHHATDPITDEVIHLSSGFSSRANIADKYNALLDMDRGCYVGLMLIALDTSLVQSSFLPISSAVEKYPVSCFEQGSEVVTEIDDLENNLALIEPESTILGMEPRRKPWYVSP